MEKTASEEGSLGAFGVGVLASYVTWAAMLGWVLSYLNPPLLLHVVLAFGGAGMVMFAVFFGLLFKRARGVAFGVGTVIPAIWLLTAGFGAAWRALMWASTHVADVWVQAAGLAAVSVLATSLYAIRCHFRIFYGVTEIAFGCFVAWHRLDDVQAAELFSRSADASFAIAMLTGSVYIFVRGLDNAHQGWKASQATGLLTVRPAATVSPTAT